MVITDQQKLDLVQEIWDKAYSCDSCPFLAEYTQPQPYGSGIAYEVLCECEVLESSKYKPEDCPKLANKIFDLEWEKEQNE